MTHTNTILIVDDQVFGRETLRALLDTEGYRLEFASNGREALTQATRLLPDLILLDVMMPDMDGFQVCRHIRADVLVSEVPIIMVTGLDDQESRMHGIEAGADDFISKPFNQTELRARVRTTTRLNRYRRLMEERVRFERVVELSPDGLLIVSPCGEILLANPAIRAMVHRDTPKDEAMVGRLVFDFMVDKERATISASLSGVIDSTTHIAGIETMFIGDNGEQFPVEVTFGYIKWDSVPAVQMSVRDITERKLAEVEIRRSKEELERAYDATLVGWVRALDLRDHETEGHSQRVTEMTLRFAQLVGIEGDELEHIRRGALLHDIGKMGIPDNILLKPDKLTPDEWHIMRQHPVHSYEWLSPIEYLRPAIDIPYCHHEKWDGSGYPRGLVGEEIPIAARLFAVVDVWDALSSNRPYHTAWQRTDIIELIRSESGKHFQPTLVALFLQLVDTDPLFSTPSSQHNALS